MRTTVITPHDSTSPAEVHAPRHIPHRDIAAKILAFGLSILTTSSIPSRETEYDGHTEKMIGWFNLMDDGALFVYPCNDSSDDDLHALIAIVCDMVDADAVTEGVIYNVWTEPPN